MQILEKLICNTYKLEKDLGSGIYKVDPQILSKKQIVIKLEKSKFYVKEKAVNI